MLDDKKIEDSERSEAKRIYGRKVSSVWNIVFKLVVSEWFSIFNKLKKRKIGIINSVKSVDIPLVHWYLLIGNKFWLLDLHIKAEVIEKKIRVMILDILWLLIFGVVIMNNAKACQTIYGICQSTLLQAGEWKDVGFFPFKISFLQL